MSASSVILDEIAYLERFEGISVLFAVEGGSRAWGFNSVNSDYDIRFVYRRQLPEYLRFESQKDTIEWKNGNLDMVGWDLVKFLRLMRESNVSAFEWLDSPIVYREYSHWDLVKKLSNRCFDPVSTVYHHIGQAKSTMKAHFKGDFVPAKRYLYVIRSIFAAEYVLSHFKRVPVPFIDLFQDRNWSLSDEISDTIADLLNSKRVDLENVGHPRDVDLENWIDGSLEHIEATVKDYRHREKPDWREFDEILLKMLGIFPL